MALHCEAGCGGAQITPDATVSARLCGTRSDFSLARNLRALTFPQGAGKLAASVPSWTTPGPLFGGCKQNEAFRRDFCLKEVDGRVKPLVKPGT